MLGIFKQLHVGVQQVLALQEGVTLCYVLEEYYRIKTLRSPRSCASWNWPRRRKLDVCVVDDIGFVKYEYGKEKKVLPSLVYDPRPPAYRSTPECSIKSLQEDLLKTDASSVNLLDLFHIYHILHLLHERSSIISNLSHSHST